MFSRSGGEFMKENLMKTKDTITNYWSNRTKGQKITFISSVIFIVIIIVVLSLFAFNTKYIPLYNNLSIHEVNQIKAELDERNISYQLTEGGTVIKVPEQNADELLVDLAGMNIPSSGGIDYSFFSENASWGITDNEFNMMRLDAIQTELSNLITQIEGIQDANVMITLPEESVFISDQQDEASAAIMLHTDPGYQLKSNQIDALYHLVSKAVPHLPAENVVINNQYFEYYEEQDSFGGSTQDGYTYQQTVKKDIERDIQRRLQQMIGSMVGMDKVIVSVTTDVDFTNENRVEELIEPVDVDNMEGLPVSVETIHETYTGNDAGGVGGTGDTDVPNYPGTTGDDEGEYELVKEMINNEFNHIRKEIVESPYKIRDVGIQVAVDQSIGKEDGEVQLLSAQEQSAVEEGITSILHSIIQTSVDKEYGEVDPSEKISIVFQEFSEKPMVEPKGVKSVPLWVYITGIALLLLVFALLFALLRKGKRVEYVEEEVSEEIAATTEIPDIKSNPDNEVEIRRKQLKQMATDKPEEFTKLLRSWIADD